MILDIHTHHAAPQPLGIIDVSQSDLGTFVPADGQLYSVGIHPWNTVDPVPEESWKRVEELLRLPCFAAVGEGGVDLSGRGGMLFRQLQVFKRLIELSESLAKPLIIHCVKAEDIICGLIRDLRPTQPWIIHGFRKKPATAQQLLRAGCWLSLGPLFNPDTLREIPDDRLLAETDDSSLDIQQVIQNLSNVRNKDLTDIIAANAASVTHLNN